MWEDNRKKTIIKNLILALLILILVTGLVYAMLNVRRETEAHDAELSAIQIQQQKQQDEARQESVSVIDAEYEKDLQTIASYMPGIVCWGDAVTLGSSGSVAYPYVLQKYIDTYICDIYDFRSTIENAEDFSRLKWDDYKVSIPVVNMGAGKEDSSTVLGRSGAVPYVVESDFEIPAEAEPVPLSICSQNGRSVTLLIGGSAGVNNVVINGVEGTLSMDSELYNKKDIASYMFTRTQPGEAVSVSSGTVVQTAVSNMYKDYIHIVCIGTYGGYDKDADVLVQQTKELLARQTQNSDRYLVLGVYSFEGLTGANYQLRTIDTAMMQAFGDRYVNIRMYLCGDGMADAGITTQTSGDRVALYNYAVPASFLSANHGIDLNAKAQKLIGKLIFNRMENLGFFDEIYSELNIPETTKLILKDDPSYFNTMIENALK